MSSEQALTFKAVVDASGFDAAIREMIAQMQQFQQQLTNANNQMKTAFSGAAPQMQQITQQERQWSTETMNLSQSHRTLGQSLKDNALAIGVTASSVVGLITQFHGLEMAHIAVERAQLRVNTSSLAVTKAQEAYNAAVAKYGPNSQQAQDAERKLANAREANSVATQRLQGVQNRYNDELLSFVTQIGPNIINIGAGIVSMFSNMRASSTAAAAANDLFTGSMATMKGGAIAVAEADLMMAGAEDTAATATGGLGMAFLRIAGPIGVAIGLFLAIEYNLFGLGDAFRSTVTVIGVGVDAIANDIINLWNQFVGLLNNMATFQAQWTNLWINVDLGVVNALQSLIKAGQTFAADFVNALVAIPNNFITYVINPILGAWNNFLANLRAPVAGAIGAILGAFTQMGGAISNAIKSLTMGKVDLSKSIVMPQITMPKFEGAATLGALPTVDVAAAATGSKELTAVQAQLARQLIDTTSAGHSYDFMLKEANVTTGEQIAAIVNYYSKHENMQALLNSKVAPALKNAIQGIVGMTQGMLGGSQAADQQGAALAKTGAAAAVTSEHYKKLSDDINKNSKEIALRSQEMTTGDEYQKQYTAGVQAADLALLDLNDANVNARGTIEETNKQIQAGTFQLSNYQKGVLDTGKAYDDAVAKLSQLDGQLNNSTAIMNRHNTAVVNGKVAFADFIIKAQDAATTQKEYDTELTNMTGEFFKLNPLLQQDEKSMELVGKAMQGDAQAAKDLAAAMQKAFEPLGQAVSKLIDDVAGKFDDLNKRVKKPLADIPKYIRDAMTPDEKQFVITQARFKVLGEQAAGAFGVALMTHGAQGGLDFLQKLQDNLKGADLKGALQPAITDLQNAVAFSGTPAGRQWVQKAIAELHKLGLDTPEITKQLVDQFGNSGLPAGQKFGQNFNSAVMKTWSQLSAAMSQLFAAPHPGAQATLQSRFFGAGGVPTVGPGAAGGGAAAAAGPTDALTKSLSLLNAVMVNTQKDASVMNSVLINTSKDLSLVNSVAVNTSRDFSVVNSVIVNSSKDFSEANAVLVNTSKDLSQANAVSVNSAKDFSDLNAVIVNTSKDFSLANAVLVNTSRDLDAVNSSAGSATSGLAKLASEVGSALVDAMDSANRVLSNLRSNLNNVGSAASSAAGEVGSLASAIDSLHSKSITVNVGLTGPGVGFLQHGYHGVVSGPHLFVIGEAGPERVDVSPIGGGADTEMTSQRITSGSLVDGLVHADRPVSGPSNLAANINVTVYLDSSKMMTQTFQQVLVRRVATAAG